LIFLFVLIILAGAGFYLGWAQAGVPPGTYGVMRSKTHGTDLRFIKGGEIRWVWYKLIPGNVKILTLSPRRMKADLHSSGSLPSGDVYASIAQAPTDFSWELLGEFSFSIKPDALPSLAEKENWAGENDLSSYEETLAKRLESFILAKLSDYGSDEAKMEKLLTSLPLPDLNSAAETAFPEVENFNCILRAVKFPDYRLYRSLRSLYEEYLARQESILKEDLAGDAEAKVASKLRMDELFKYGELLTKYPVLLQYLALEKNSDQVFDKPGP
jgi:hypothetical protein